MQSNYELLWTDVDQSEYFNVDFLPSAKFYWSLKVVLEVKQVDGQTDEHVLLFCALLSNSA